MQFAYSMRYAAIILTAASLIFHHAFYFSHVLCRPPKGKEDIIPGGIDKIPFDLLLAILFVIGVLEFAVISEIHYTDTFGMVLIIISFLILDVLILLLACMSFAVRYKLGGWWKNTIIWRFLHFN